MHILNKIIKKNYLTKKILGTNEDYLSLHNLSKYQLSKITIEIEERTGEKLNDDYFEDLALHTQVVIKKSKLNYQHGKMLYSILSNYIKKTKLSFYNILETGTARGFSSICMSKALINAHAFGKIYTIDILPHDKKMYWNCIDDNEGMKTRNSLLNRWKNETNNIVFINDETSHFVKKFHIDRIHFAFLDAEHKFKNVMEEFYYVNSKQKDGDCIFFDDVTPNLFPGVVKAVKNIENKYNYKVEYYSATEQRGYALAVKQK